MKKPQDEIYNKIDDYEQTLHAIVGFMNFYRYDDDARKMKEDVTVFQGRRFDPSPEKAVTENGDKVTQVTPDLGVLPASAEGVLGEVKKSFPADETRWMKTFKQLMSYDDNLDGWPTKDGKLSSHDIVLLLHQTRAAAIKRYYEANSGKDIKFTRPFTMIQFNRADERRPYFFFQKTTGNLTDKSVDTKLIDGVSVPMEIFVTTYSTVKIYDSLPPLAYLIELIWTNVVLPRASDTSKFPALRKNQKIEVTLSVDDIVNELHNGFSFHGLSKDIADRQPKVPKREWIMSACEKLVQSDEASWVDTEKSQIKVYFRKYDSVMSHFIDICADEQEEDAQITMFD